MCEQGNNRLPECPPMSVWIRKLIFAIAAALLSLGAQRHSFAGSATWGTNPLNGDWNTAANWMPNTVPNGPGDVATFGTSDVTNLSINTTAVEVDMIVFNSGAALLRSPSTQGTGS